MGFRSLQENLFVHFSIVALLIMGTMAVVLVYVLSNKIESGAVNDLIDEAVGASAGRLLGAIKPGDLETPMIGERYDRFHEFVQQSIVSDRTARVKIWAKDGTVIYSNDPAGVGEKFPTKANLLTALGGDNAIEIKRPGDAENKREEYLGTLMEVYTPIIFPGTAEPQGAFEVYQYYLPTAQRIDSLRKTIFWSIGGGFLILYAGLVSIVWRGSQTINGQRRRLEETLSELKGAQEQMIQQERLRALGQLASGIAHDFNNTLTPILGFSELLLERLDQEEEKQETKGHLELIHTAAQDAAAVVARLREFYRKRDEAEVLRDVSLNDLAMQAISLTQAKWKDEAQAKGATVSIKTDLQELRPVLSNESEVRELLINLLLNAVAAMPDGGTITIRTRPDGDYAALEVSDTGTGMTEAVRQRVLEPFFTTKGPQGTGLGLAMVHGIVRRHDGTIDIESELGKGTTFVVRLPVSTRDPSEVRRERTEAKPGGPLRVLVVEDEPKVLQLLMEYLSSDGHSVVTASNGREGLEKFNGADFDIVLTDRAMPEMSGDQLAAAIKQVAPNKPVMMLTGFGDMLQSTDENPPGVDLIVGKPVTLNDLRHALLSLVGAEPALATSNSA